MANTPWPHAPTHQLSESGTYFVTGSTFNKVHHFKGPKRLELLQRGLLKLARDYAWQFEAWAVFSNHYHFVAHSPEASENAESLREVLATLHARTAGWINRMDGAPGRQVWFNYWDTRLTYHKSYLARLNYVHQNPVRHRLVKVANQYPWCSAGWFERCAPPSQVKSVYRFDANRVHVEDDFEPDGDW